MKISRLYIKNYRSYDELEVIFENGINYLFGVNGAGKTNIIEAIYYIGNLESFRTYEDKYLIKESQKEFVIEAVVNDKKYKLEVNKESKNLSIDGIVYKKYRDYIGRANVVEFCPEEVYLLKDYPKGRRRFMDREISKIDNEYLNKLLIYNKLLKQRNDMLRKAGNYSKTYIEVIDEKISELQIVIIRKRKEFLKRIESETRKIGQCLENVYDIEIKYETGLDNLTKEKILNKYKESLEKDIDKGVTSIGIHKDDFKLYVNKNEVSCHGSQGEQRLIILLIKLALVNLIKETKGEFPLVVLDDVLSELDLKNKGAIFKVIEKIEQVFITGCEYLEMDQGTNCTYYEVKQSKLLKKEEDNNGK